MHETLPSSNLGVPQLVKTSKQCILACMTGLLEASISCATYRYHNASQPQWQDMAWCMAATADQHPIQPLDSLSHIVQAAYVQADKLLQGPSITMCRQWHEPLHGGDMSSSRHWLRLAGPCHYERYQWQTHHAGERITCEHHVCRRTGALWEWSTGRREQTRSTCTCRLDQASMCIQVQLPYGQANTEC